MFDTEKFIKEVEIRPTIYNSRSKDYYNKELKQKSWHEIGNAMFDDWESLDDGEKFDTVVDLMKKWKFVRDAFVRDFKTRILGQFPKKNPRKKKYIFSDQLLFLIPCIKGLKIEIVEVESPVSSPNTLEEGTPLDASDFGSNDDSHQAPAVKKSKNNYILSEESADRRKSPKHSQKTVSSDWKRARKEEEADDYGHRSFLSSFVPILCSMPVYEAMLARQRISEIFSDHCQSSAAN